MMSQPGGGRRVLYVQYTNPGAYPPLEHSAHLMAERGCDVLFVGIKGVTDPLIMAPHDRIAHRHWPPRLGGPGQKAHYVAFLFRVLAIAWRWRPDWIYASDPLSCPVALVLGAVTRVPVVYHEHDSPSARNSGRSAFGRLVLWARRQVARRAAVSVLPNGERARLFQSATGATDIMTIWNCPRRSEIARAPVTVHSGTRVLYHGSIVPSRLPHSVIQAIARLPESVSLTIIGYETVGHPGYVADLLSLAADLGVATRVRYLGAMSRADLLRECPGYDVGLSFLPSGSDDLNERTMVGASNKVFDYLACGLAVLVGDQPAWREAFVASGLGYACDPASADSIAEALGAIAADPALRVAMGERGRRRVADEWNYETTFAPLLARLTAERPLTSLRPQHTRTI